ncbi:DUF3226 domain-containing protein [Fusobacterium mortiferum]|uniref:DUF3226 domain-containing protein n=1 Tax=Fusobacterium mortiferum TaxID=850 RepID=UPI00158A9C50|nr:DUF3226 domain-containing protein [Fusobacterium mortiferum]
MKSIILCEGGTDLTLIQYFMEKVNGWKYHSNRPKLFDLEQQKRFKKEDKILEIGATGGCTEIPKCFSKILNSQRIGSNSEERYENIVIITDNDEINTFNNMKATLENLFNKYSITIKNNIANDSWINCTCENGAQDIINFRVLLLIIPFEEEGALETFLLKAIASKDEYDNEIIEKGNIFVETVDPQKKYLVRRRYVTKAKLDVYFSIRTPVDQFTERQNILKSINWEDYEYIRNSFKKLREL